MSQATAAADIIRQRILDGDLSAGDRLGEAEIAEELDMSRTPVREALRILAADGLLEIQNNKGARVTEWSEDELTSVFEIRIRLESLAARRAAERSTPEDVRVLREYAEKIKHYSQPGSVRDFAQISKYNSLFHSEILRISASEALTVAVDRVMFVAVLARTRHAMDDEAMARSANHHFEITAAIAAHQPDWADSTMRSHILSARTALFGTMTSRPSPSTISSDLADGN